jgi:hypothetical protein
MFNRHTLAIHRLTPTVGAHDEYTATGETVTGRLDPIDAEFAAIGGGSFSKSYRLFAKGTGMDVTDNDRLVDEEDGEEYEVRGVQTFNHPPRHMEIVLERVLKPVIP